MSYITAIGTANPRNKLSQSAITDFMVKAMQLQDGDERKLRTIFRATGIDHRFSVLSDYGLENAFTFFPNNAGMHPFPSTQKRLDVFQTEALPLSVAAVADMAQAVPSFDSSSITHLIVVCCTGMYAPGLDIDLVKALALPRTVQRTCITFMGCYAAFNALKVADAFCKAGDDAKVLIVCTELCSIHFQKEATDDNLLANALFADGAAAVLVEAKPTVPKRLSIQAFHNELATEGEHDMAWKIGDLGFEMKLSTYVPDIIKSGIVKLTNALLEKLTINLEEIKHFAIHPGGKKILNAIEDALHIDRNKNAAAYKVLRDHGNMSSPTVLFVLKEIFNTLNDSNNDEYLLSFAFGPGLTLESMLLKIETNYA